MRDQITPDGYYNISRMIQRVARKGKIGACGICLDACGLTKLQLIENVHRSSMDELARWVIESEKVLNF
jgi:uncharacterized protein involved in oxidation of intracellular sulfur